MKFRVTAAALVLCIVGSSETADAFSAVGMRASLLNCLNKSLSPSDRVEACNQVIHTNELIRQYRARVVVARGNAWFAASEYQKALDDYNQAIELNPELPEAVASRAVTLVQLGKCDQAAPDLSAMLEADGHSWRALYGRSLCEAKRGDTEKAALDLSAATAVNPNAANAFTPVEIEPWFR